MLQRENKKVKKNNFFYASCSGYLIAKSTFFIEWNFRYCKNYRQTKTWSRKVGSFTFHTFFPIGFFLPCKSRVLRQYHNLFPMPLYCLLLPSTSSLTLCGKPEGKKRRPNDEDRRRHKNRRKSITFQTFPSSPSPSLFIKSQIFFPHFFLFNVLLAPLLWVECLLSYLKVTE